MMNTITGEELKSKELENNIVKQLLKIVFDNNLTISEVVGIFEYTVYLLKKRAHFYEEDLVD